MLTVDFDLLDVKKGDVILDAGCGEGRHSFECIARGADVCSMDIDMESLKKARYILAAIKLKEDASYHGRFQIHIGDALNLPFKEETFDKIICSEVMEHVDDDDIACRELSRALKKGGKIAITIPTFFSEFLYDIATEEYFTSPGGHVRKYLPNKIVDLMTRNNLEIYDVKFKHSFHAIYWFIRCVVGLHLENHLFTRTYRKFLSLASDSRVMTKVEQICDFFFPKSMVFYASKK